MKFKQLQTLSVEDRTKKLNEAKRELLKLNGQVATGTAPKSPGQIKELKKTIAKLMVLSK
jgi:large subunit ribosomal protein L29